MCKLHLKDSAFLLLLLLDQGNFTAIATRFLYPQVKEFLVYIQNVEKQLTLNFYSIFQYQAVSEAKTHFYGDCNIFSTQDNSNNSFLVPLQCWDGVWLMFTNSWSHTSLTLIYIYYLQT